MPPILIVLLVAGVGFLLYERFIAPGAPGTPQPPPPTAGARCVPATNITSGRQYRFAMIPVGKGDSQTTPAQVAAMVSTGNLWVGVQAWTSVDPSVPAYSWPAAAQPGPGVFLVQATYAGSAAAVPQQGIVFGVLDCGPAPTAGAADGATATGPSGAPGYHLIGPVVNPQAAQAQPATTSPHTVSLNVRGIGGFTAAMQASQIQQAAQVQLAALGPQPQGMTQSLQWQIAQASLSQLYSQPTVANLRATVMSLVAPSQGVYANNAAQGLEPLLTQFGG